MADTVPGPTRIVNLMDYRQARAPRASDEGGHDLGPLATRPALSARAVLHRERMLAHLQAQLTGRAAR